MNGYLVEVKELQHRPGTKDVVLVDVADVETQMKWASINQELSKCKDCFESYNDILFQLAWFLTRSHW